MTDAPERITARQVAAITGMKVRTVQLKAARGEIPSAVRYGGPGSPWYFDEVRVRKWIAELESATARRREAPTWRGSPMSQGSLLDSREIGDAYDRILGRGSKRPRPRGARKGPSIT